jgi:hypothetical protein
MSRNSLAACNACGRCVSKKAARDARSKWRPVGNDWYCCTPGRCSLAYKAAASPKTLTDSQVDAILRPVYADMAFDELLADLIGEARPMLAAR